MNKIRGNNTLTGNTDGTICQKCGKPFGYVGDAPEGGFTPGTEPYCTCYVIDKVTPYWIPNHPQGWICPQCGRSLSPTQMFCPFCPTYPEKYTITCKG